MKKIIILAYLSLLVTGLWAQTDKPKGAIVVNPSQATTVNDNNYTIQVGMPFLGQHIDSITRTNTPFDIRFPWDILYLNNTFAPGYFDVSKGYFGDKILLEWTVLENKDLVTGYEIFRKKYTVNDTEGYISIGAAADNAVSYEDKYVEGGVLYQYKIVALGLGAIEIENNNYFTGIGYRNPTATATGSVSFKGGNPVEDVTLKATPVGGSANLGSALKIPGTGSLEINGLNKPITTTTTLQAWMRPETAYKDDAEDPIRLFQLKNGENTIDININLKPLSKTLIVDIEGSEFTIQNFYPSGRLDDRGNDILVPISDFNTNFVHFSVVLEDGKAPLLYINGRAINNDYSKTVKDLLNENNKDYEGPYLEVTVPEQITVLSFPGIETNWSNIEVGGVKGSYIDEIRIWNSVKEPKKIRTNYRRYISGNDVSLISYLRANEGVGNFAYDLSRTGFEYNKNHGELRDLNTISGAEVIWVSGVGNIPTSSQLGVLGVTDANGNYEISAIPYTGTGESFTITPSLGLHEFEPSQQLVFLGQGSEVVNKINFVDISSFSFKGKVLFDTRSVFKSFVDVNSVDDSPNFSNLTDGDEYVSESEIIRDGEGYNNYETVTFGKKSKGEYWLNNNGTTDDETDDYLERYAAIASEGVNIYIDGNIVLDENNMPVVSDANGNFEVSVPIGNHYITLKKQGHTFTHNSRFPAQTGTFKEFFEDANEQVIFIDNTRVTVVGRVVGGGVQAAKVIGFGEKGLFETNDTDSTTVVISSKNNIGIADITLGHKPGGSAVSNYTKFNFKTNSESGEYRVSALPLKYELLPTDIKIPSSTPNNTISILEPGSDAESFDYTKVIALTTPVFEYENEILEKGKPYHYEKSFTYRSTPALKVVEQTSDKTLTINNVDISTEGFEHPLYSQFEEYKVILNRFERYTNYDACLVEGDDCAIEDLVPVVDGELVINNNFELPGSGKLVPDSKDGSILTYTFKGGMPSTDVSTDFVLTSTLKYRLNGVDYDVEDYKGTGIILGGQSDGEQTFVTAAPDIPDFILRDPPGSNSFASIEEGTTISFTTESSFSASQSISTNLRLMLGVKFEAGGGLAGPVISSEGINNIEAGIGYTNNSTNGRSLTKSYNFTQTVSTSDDPDYVGSDGDLYIGVSKNYFYGSFDDIMASTSVIGDSEYVELTNVQGESIFISKQKSSSFVEEPSKTLFVFSQKHILTTLIPEYESFISDIENGLLTEGVDGTLTIDEYKQQIQLWKKLILENEKNKYQAQYKRPRYKSTLTNIIDQFNSETIEAINKTDDDSVENNLTKKLDESKRIKTLLEKNFYDNISFDAGVGDFTRSVETGKIASTSLEYNISVDESFAFQLGYAFNETGLVNNTRGVLEQNTDASLTGEKETTKKISYTLRDNDPANLLSVDVVNAFDGNGPIFITQGGRTSCPYEGAEESLFFTKDKYETFFIELFKIEDKINDKKKELLAKQKELNTNDKVYYELVRTNDHQINDAKIEQNKAERIILKNEKVELDKELTVLEESLASHNNSFFNNIDCCPDGAIGSDGKEVEKAQLSFATQKVENIKLTIEGSNDISNIPEGQNAEFVLKLENLSDISSSNNSFNYFDLGVDNTTNPDGAIINIGANGNSVYVPYGEPVYYTLTLGKGKSDVYDYKDIKIYLASSCDSNNVKSEVQVSAQFIPSCSIVEINTPLNNWTYNRDVAYNQDASTNPLMVNMRGFNTAFASFQKIDLQYRLATSPNWTRLHTYYNTEEFFDEAVLNGESEISLIGSADLSFSFDIANLNLPDGDYEIRAKSLCVNKTEFISDIITGRVDLSSPQKFGTPLPIDGILGSGEDLKVSFNENIFYTSGISNIEIKGQTNQLLIKNNISLYFEGDNNTAVINNPKTTSGDFTLEFWMNNNTIDENADIINQDNGLNIRLSNGEIYFTLADLTVQGGIANDGLFHHYTFTYKNSTGEISIYQDDTIIGENTGSPNLQFTNNNALVIGGNTFIGNMHNLRIWNKTITLDNAYAKMYDKLIGNEANLVGYWPMDKGRGSIAKDLARFKHAVVNSSWDIKPKGNSWEFTRSYLTFDEVGFVQLTNEMDATISFWIKTATGQESTIFSNGRGDGSDIVQTNGLANKWAINMSNTGNLSLESEGTSYPLTVKSVADNTWHHVTLLFNRNGSLRTHVDAEQVSSNSMAAIGGFSGNKAWLGARGFKNQEGETVDRLFTGKIDEFRLWNTLRNVEQISRDRYNEVDNQSTGLLLYARMNAPEPLTENGPRYYHADTGINVPDNAVLSSGVVNYSNDVPAIKPERELINFQVSHVINEDEMIIEPVVTDWASLEGQVLDITVHRMFDDANNMQQSPITWTAFIQRNDVSWFAEGYNEVVDIVQNNGEAQSFEIVIVNRGGNPQPYTIANVPSWMSLSSASGTIAPDSRTTITVTFDKELTVGEYLENLSLQTDFGYDQKLQVDLRVLGEEPDWIVDPNDYDYSMNIVGKIKIDGVFTDDLYDKVAAFSSGEVRGVANVVYDESYQEYFVFLTVYSNNVSGDPINFSVWDATKGQIIQATINTNASVLFTENNVLGSLSNPSLFENTNVVQQEIDVNDGWTWISMNVNDPNFSNLNALISNATLETSDRILSHSPAQLETYYKDESIPANSAWTGTISANGGVSTNFMYKVNFANAQRLTIKGAPVDISTWSFPIKQNWNWLPYPLNKNVSVAEALSLFDAVDGDIIKSQNLFAIYDPLNGWTGTLNYLEEGQGYMIKSSQDQTFKYSNIYSNRKSASSLKSQHQARIKSEFTKYSENMNAIVLLPEGYNELYVYDQEGILKGQANKQTVGNKELSFITIYGDTSKELTFHIGNNHSKKVTSKGFVFKGNEVLGTVANPIVLEDSALENIKIYPNPFDKDLVLKLTSEKQQVMEVKLYNMLSQLVYSNEKQLELGINSVVISPEVENGVYILSVYVNNVITTYRVIKN